MRTEELVRDEGWVENILNIEKDRIKYRQKNHHKKLPLALR